MAQGNEDLTWHEGDMPYSQRFGDHYYTRAGGLAETDHVFIAGNGLPERWRDRGNFTIAELGFGTGLNMLQTWRRFRATSGAGRLALLSLEAYPLSATDIARALRPWPELALETQRLLADWPDAPGDERIITIELDERTDLTVLIGAAAERIADLPQDVDAWYLDGFAPARNPAMWDEKLLDAVFAHTAPGGTFASYTAAGWVRRNLQAAGFIVEKRAGFAGKREMIAGYRPTTRASSQTSIF